MATAPWLRKSPPVHQCAHSDGLGKNCFGLLLCFCCCSVAKSCPTLWDPMDCSIPGLPILHYFPEFAQTHVHSCHLSRWCHPTISSSVTPFTSWPQSFPALEFQWVGSSYQGPKYWSLSFSISPSNEYSGLVSFRMDWFDLLAVQGTLKSLLQHYSLKALILWCSAFFIDQLSHLYMTTCKAIALTIQTFAGKVMTLLLNMLSRFVISFLPSRKHLFIYGCSTHHR